ncbi:MAG: OmpA family protein [Saprospiraceae bacterium]|nr:OmpA family protein [Saprospiraceae bacterium]
MRIIHLPYTCIQNFISMKNYLLIFALSLIIGNVLAQSPASQGVSAISAKLLFIDYGMPNNVDNLDITNGLEIGYTRHFSRFVGLTVPLKVGVANISGVQDNVNIVSLDALLRLQYFKEQARLVPYVFGGAGYVSERFESGNLQIPVGLGLDIRVGRNSYVNLQGEYRLSQEDLRKNMQLGLGFVYRLGKNDADRDGVSDALDKCPNIPGVAALGGCPDADGDGIADADDKCPDQAGSKMTNGCPDTDGDGLADKDDDCPEVAGTMNGCPDTDGDGLADNIDQCPEEKGVVALSGCPDDDNDGVANRNDDCPTEAGPAENKGCPITDRDGDGIDDVDDACPDQAGSATAKGCPDRDNDGVADASDRCPDDYGKFEGCPDTDGDGLVDPDDTCPRLAGPVSNKGCPEVKKEDQALLITAMRSVKFETGKTTLRSESYAILDQVVDIMNRYAGYSLAIAGHTDDVGSDKINLDLSEGRAKACYDYLVSKGIDAVRMTYKGYGETQPVASNKSTKGRSLNRRVEFNLYVK